MAWFLNTYKCTVCGVDWHAEWSCMCDDECPNCHTAHEPLSSQDMSVYTEQQSNGSYTIMFSPPFADCEPSYEVFATVNDLAVVAAVERRALEMSREP